MSPPNGSPAPLAQWHAVTPLTRPLSISILELAPTSVTLALTRSPPTPPSLTPAQHLAQSHAHHHAHSGSASSSHNGGGSGSKNKKKKKRNATSNLQHSTSNAADSEDGADDDGDESGSQSVTTGPSPLVSLLGEGQTFKDMLSHGVVVTLDGMPWSRIVAHVSDDEADGEGPAGQGDEQDEDGEWEDDWEPAGGTDAAADEGQANTTSSARPAARRRKRKGAQGSNDAGRVHVPRPIRTKDTQDRPQRWDRERAVVVVYDLDASQEHEIELQIVGLAGEIKDNVPVSNSVLIPPASPSAATLHPRSRANSLRSRSRPRSRSNSVNTAAPTGAGPSPLGTEVPASPNRSSTPINDQPVAVTSILSPHDAQIAQTRHLITAAHAEREHLQTQIKEARKTAQRSEASLRTDIESMKKSNEKAGANDQRNKQKYLALQEQVKQGWAGAEAANKEADDVKASTPELEKKLETVTEDVESVRKDWSTAQEEEEEAKEADKKSRAEEDKKLADVTNKIDKLKVKKEKKEAERAELQKRLDELEKQREEIERKTEEERNLRKQGYYPGVNRWEHGSGDFNAPGGAPGGFEGSSRPGPGGYGAPPFRPRGGYPRFPSGGRGQGKGFYGNTPPSPAWNAQMAKPSRPPGGTGPNPSAAPFMPSGNFNANDPSLHTALMPPQLQHRIYLPNSVRPRPTPNFHPPPSVLAEQAQQNSNVPPATTKAAGSGAAFPPLPTTAPQRPNSAQQGPSLASIVTRAVLAPTSTLASPAQSGTPASPTASSPAPGSSGKSSVSPKLSHPQFQQQRGEFPPLSPSAPAFTSPNAPNGRTSSPPRTSPGSGWGAVGTPPATTE